MFLLLYRYSILFFFKKKSTGHGNNIKRIGPPALDCDHPSLILESVVKSLPSFRKTALVDKLVES